MPTFICGFLGNDIEQSQQTTHSERACLQFKEMIAAKIVALEIMP